MLRGDSCFLLLAIVSSPGLDNGGSLEPVGLPASVGLFATNILLSFSLCRLILQYPMTSHKSEERSSHGCYRGVNDNEYLVVGRMKRSIRKTNKNMPSLFLVLVPMACKPSSSTGRCNRCCSQIMSSAVPSSWINRSQNKFHYLSTLSHQ